MGGTRTAHINTIHDDDDGDDDDDDDDVGRTNAVRHTTATPGVAGSLGETRTAHINTIHDDDDDDDGDDCLLYTSPSPRDRLVSRMPSSA